MPDRPTVPAYPPSRRDDDASITRHGMRFADPYGWLADLASPEARAWVEAQEALTRRVLDAVPGRPALQRAANAAARYDRRTPPGGSGCESWWEADAGEERLRLVMRRDADAAPQTVLDPNGWPAGETLAFAELSPDGRLVAFGVATGDRRGPRIRVLDVESGVLLADDPYGTDHGSVAWRPGSPSFFYTACPAPGDVPPGEETMWHAVYEHTVGSEAPARKVLGHRVHGEYWYSVEVSDCGRFAVIHEWDFVNANTAYLIRLADDRRRRVTPLMAAVNRVQVLDDRLLITTDWLAPRGRACGAAIERPTDWATPIRESPDILQTAVGVAGRYYAVYSRGGAHEVSVFDRRGRLLQSLPLPGIGSVNRNEGSGVISGISGRWRGGDVWVEFQSFLQPPSTYRHDFENNALVPVHVPVAGLDAGAYVTEREWCRSADDTPVPITVVRHRDTPLDGTNFVRLSGYGGFGVPVEPRYTPVAAAWLALGGVLAFAHVRGGGERGAAWHEAAVKTGRHHAFDDYVAAARRLVDLGYTTADRLVSRGNSNGGLLVAAAALRAPDAFGGVFCRAALLDLLRFPEFGFLAAAKVEYGDPDDPIEGAYLASYSPYHAIRSGVRYPPMTFAAALDDAIAPPHDPAKMVARLQGEGAAGGPFLFLPLRDSGHAGAATLGGLVAQDVDELAACCWMLGVDLDAAGGRLRS